MRLFDKQQQQQQQQHFYSSNKSGSNKSYLIEKLDSQFWRMLLLFVEAF